MTGLSWEWRGPLRYGPALEEQRERRRQVQEGAAPEVLWLLEHPPVVTTGRRPAPGVPDAETLAAEGVELYAVERGGLATWHGPGQLVAYTIVDAGRRGFGPRRLIEALEDETETVGGPLIIGTVLGLRWPAQNWKMKPLGSSERGKLIGNPLRVAGNVVPGTMTMPRPGTNTPDRF